MPRIRTIKPEYFQHEVLFDAEASSGLPLRVAFAGLWCQADREGRFKWRPRTLKVQILPYDDVDFGAVLDALEAAGVVRSYEIEGERYGCIPSWRKHQRIQTREPESTIPAPETSANTGAPAEADTNQCQGTAEAMPEHCRGTGERKGKERKGKEVAAAAARGSDSGSGGNQWAGPKPQTIAWVTHHWNYSEEHQREVILPHFLAWASAQPWWETRPGSAEARYMRWCQDQRQRHDGPPPKPPTKDELEAAALVVESFTISEETHGERH